MSYPAVPGFGGGMFPINAPPAFPDYMLGINQALAQNQALGAQQAVEAPKSSFGAKLGDFLKAWAGSLGDSLTGNPVYASHQRSQQEAKLQAEQAAAAEEARQRMRVEDFEDWRKRQEYERANRPQNFEGNIDHYRQALELGLIPQGTSYPSFLGMVNPSAQAPVMLPYGYDQVGGGATPSSGPSSVGMTATNPQTGEKVRFNPQTNQWEPMGGTGSNAGGGFLR